MEMRVRDWKKVLSSLPSQGSGKNLIAKIRDAIDATPDHWIVRVELDETPVPTPGQERLLLRSAAANSGAEVTHDDMAEGA